MVKGGSCGLVLVFVEQCVDDCLMLVAGKRVSGLGFMGGKNADSLALGEEVFFQSEQVGVAHFSGDGNVKLAVQIPAVFGKRYFPCRGEFLSVPFEFLCVRIMGGEAGDARFDKHSGLVDHVDVVD